jgi:hypothetical protein
MLRRMAGLTTQELGRLLACSNSPEQRSENARHAAQARWSGGTSDKPFTLTYDQWKRLGDDGLQEICDYIKTAPGKARLTLTVAEWRVLSNWSKAMFLHKGGRVNRPRKTRAEFDQLTPREKANFINQEGGKVE